MRVATWLIGAVQLSALLLHVRGDVYTALASMEGLLRTEEEAVDFLKEHIEMEEDRIQRMRLYLQKYEKQRQEASPDFEKYIRNPINAFLMIKSLSIDWHDVETLLAGNQNHVQDFTTKKESLAFPDEMDLVGAADGLLRLQDTYKLNASALSRGELPGGILTTQLAAADCYALGVQANNLSDYSNGVLWMQQALEIVKTEKTPLVSEELILVELAYSLFMERKLHEALNITKYLLELAPDHKTAAENVIYLEDKIMESEEQARNGGGAPKTDDYFGPQDLQETIMDTYEQLCRGETVPVSRKKEELTCRYVDHHHPFYLLQPFKEEAMSIDPRIVVYHELMSDEEAKIIKEISGPRLARATVLSNHTNEYADYRISKSAWIDETSHPLVGKLDRRIEDVTGLTTKKAERLQVVNYGIGGHYEPHHDYAAEQDVRILKMWGTGNRIATLMFYMSDVEAGGATVFPHLGIAIWPRKGSAAFWYNLRRNGKEDVLTLHAACPVLVGTKWVANKWLHEEGQEFRYPCSLHATD